jgi:hypothetical protein
MSFFVKLGAVMSAQDAKEAGFEAGIKLAFNRKAPSLLSLFEDLIESHQARELCTNKKRITFLYHSNVPVFVLVSKDDLKVKIQSSDFPSLWFILKQMIQRLEDVFAGGSEDFEISLEDSIPLNELFALIEEHYSIRNEISKLKKLLEDRSY